MISISISFLEMMQRGTFLSRWVLVYIQTQEGNRKGHKREKESKHKAQNAEFRNKHGKILNIHYLVTFYFLRRHHAIQVVVDSPNVVGPLVSYTFDNNLLYLSASLPQPHKPIIIFLDSKSVPSFLTCIIKKEQLFDMLMISSSEFDMMFLLEELKIF